MGKNDTLLLMIKDKIYNILSQIPKEVLIVAASKGKSIDQINEAIEAGISLIGENYIQEAQKKIEAIGNKVRWHFIGHLQKNKVKKAVRLFDMVETLDSSGLAESLDREAEAIQKVIPVLIEVNIAGEENKSGCLPEEVDSLIKKILAFRNIKIMGLMTMGPFLDNPEDIRPFFKQAKEIFDRIKNMYGDSLDWKYLSMGMSDTYKVAIQEGANIVRIGTAIFGARDED